MSIRRRISAAVLASALVAGAVAICAPGEAQAQNIVRSGTRPGWLGLGVGPSIGIVNSPVSAHINPQFGYHFGGNTSGPAIVVDLNMYVTGGFFALTATPRFQYDIQPIGGVGFLVGPYIGFGPGFATAGGAASFLMEIPFGVDLKLVLGDRGLIWFRPVGFSVPIAISSAGAGAGFAYDIQFGGGFTF